MVPLLVRTLSLTRSIFQIYAFGYVPPSLFDIDEEEDDDDDLDTLDLEEEESEEEDTDEKALLRWKREAKGNGHRRSFVTLLYPYLFF
jgi:hypothetical protein